MSTAASPTPPAAPSTATHSPGRAPPTEPSEWYEVPYVTPIAAAERPVQPVVQRLKGLDAAAHVLGEGAERHEAEHPWPGGVAPSGGRPPHRRTRYPA